MNEHDFGSKHPDPGALVRLMDGECPDTEERRLHQHVRSCDACSDRLERLRARSRGLRTVLQEMDPVVGHRRENGRPTISPTLLRAAAVVLLLAAGMSVSPVRGWVVDRIQDVAAWVGLSNRTKVPAPAGQEADASAVEFTPAGDVLRITFSHPQHEGSVTLVTGDSETTARAEVLGRGARVEMLVLPEGLRIRNARDASSSYRIQVPVGLREVTLRIGDRREVRLGPDDLEDPGTLSWQLGRELEPGEGD